MRAAGNLEFPAGSVIWKGGEGNEGRNGTDRAYVAHRSYGTYAMGAAAVDETAILTDPGNAGMK